LSEPVEGRDDREGLELNPRIEHGLRALRLDVAHHFTSTDTQVAALHVPSHAATPIRSALDSPRVSETV
jgi:hypothetical protein